MRRIRDVVAEIVDDLSMHTDKKIDKKTKSETDETAPLVPLEKAEAAEERPLPDRWRTGKPVLCIPGPSLLDEAAATMAARLIEREGIGVRAEQAEALSMARIFSWDTQDVALICLFYVEDATPAQIRYAIRRVRRRVPHVPILVALFGDTERFKGDEDFDDAEFVQQSLRGLVDKIKAIANKPVEGQLSPSTPVAAIAS